MHALLIVMQEWDCSGLVYVERLIEVVTYMYIYKCSNIMSKLMFVNLNYFKLLAHILTMQEIIECN